MYTPIMFVNGVLWVLAKQRVPGYPLYVKPWDIIHGNKEPEILDIGK